MQIQFNFIKCQLCNIFQCADYIVLQGIQKIVYSLVYSSTSQHFVTVTYTKVDKISSKIKYI